VAIVVVCVLLVVVIAVAEEAPSHRITNPTLPYPKPTPSPTGGKNWSLLRTAASPLSISSMMAYDPSDRELILVDSEGGCGASYTWAFSGGAWVNLTPVVGPGPSPARGNGGLVYDAADGYLVLFGGSSPCGVYNDTWTFSDNVWTRLVTSSAPPRLSQFAMTYDASDGYVLMTGGCCIGGVDSRETWDFHGGLWTNLTAAETPIVASGSSMTYYPGLGAVVFVGGYASGYVSQATWTYHAGNWTRLYPAPSPSNRAGMGFAYDQALSKDVLLGGYTKITTGVFVNLTDTWTFGNGRWQNVTGDLATSPPFASGSALMEYDVATSQIVLFLGYEQTWVFG